MENKKPKADSFYERLTEARHKSYERNQNWIEECRKNPIDWNATVKAGKLIGKNKK